MSRARERERPLLRFTETSVNGIVMARYILCDLVKLAIVGIVSPRVVVVHNVSDRLELVEESVLLRGIILAALLPLLAHSLLLTLVTVDDALLVHTRTIKARELPRIFAIQRWRLAEILERICRAHAPSVPLGSGKRLSLGANDLLT